SWTKRENCFWLSDTVGSPKPCANASGSARSASFRPLGNPGTIPGSRNERRFRKDRCSKVRRVGSKACSSVKNGRPGIPASAEKSRGRKKAVPPAKIGTLLFLLSGFEYEKSTPNLIC